MIDIYCKNRTVAQISKELDAINSIYLDFAGLPISIALVGPIQFHHTPDPSRYSKLALFYLKSAKEEHPLYIG